MVVFFDLRQCVDLSKIGEQESDMRSTRGWMVLCNPLSSLCNGARHLGSPVCFCSTRKVSSVRGRREKEVRKAYNGAKKIDLEKNEDESRHVSERINSTFKGGTNLELVCV